MMRSTLLILFLAYLLLGCNLEPHYTRPETEMPTSWRFESDEGSTLVNLRWWEALGDPVLNNLILTALENNKDLQVAVWRVKEYYAQYQVVRSQLFPQVDFDASALKKKYPIDTSFLPFAFDPITPEYTGIFNLSFEFDFWGQIRSAAHAAYSQFLAQIENRRTVVLTLVGAVAGGYVLLRQLDLQLEIAQKTLETRRESLELARDRYEGGITSEIEVTQAEFVYEAALARITLLEEQIPQQENLICVLLGQSSHGIERGKAVNELILPIEVPAGLPSDLLERRPDILQAENMLLAANATIGVARAAFFPQISLTGLYGAATFELKNIFSNANRTWAIGGNLLQLIFTGGKLEGQLDVAKAQKEEAVFHYEQTILNAFREVNDALIGLKQMKELIIVTRAEVAALKEYLHLAWLRYYEGQTDYLTVLDAERQLFFSELNLAKAQGDLFLTLINLYKALGGGWVLDADCNLRDQKAKKERRLSP